MPAGVGARSSSCGAARRTARVTKRDQTINQEVHDITPSQSGRQPWPRACMRIRTTVGTWESAM